MRCTNEAILGPLSELGISQIVTPTTVFADSSAITMGAPQKTFKTAVKEDESVLEGGSSPTLGRPGPVMKSRYLSEFWERLKRWTFAITDILLIILTL